MTPFVQRELDKYPGVSAKVEHGRKHPKLVISYRGKTRFVVFSGSPSDHRAAKNDVKHVRRELRTLGAIQ